ncbi:MAG: hypothetical protein ABIF17_04290 [Patescibacteria group bacterium]
MSLTKKQIEEFKKILEKRQLEIEQYLSDFAHKHGKADGAFVPDFPDFGDKDDENASEVSTYVNRLSVDNTLEKELRDIMAALKKIRNNQYGICKYCNKDIGVERLKIRPESSSCVACKKKFKGEV